MSIGNFGGDAPYVYDKNRIEHEPTLQAWFASFDASVLKVAVPAARSYYHASNADVLNPDWVIIDKKLGELSWETIKLRKALYLKYVGLSFRHSFQSVFLYEDSASIAITLTFVAIVFGLIRRGAATRMKRRLAKVGWVGWVALAAVILVVSPRAMLHPLAVSGAVTKGRLLGSVYPLFTCFACAVITVSVFWSRLGEGKPFEISAMQRAMALCTIALLFFAWGMLPVAFVEMPLKRYILAVSPLLPGAILLVSVKWAARTWRETGVHPTALIRAGSRVSSGNVRF